LKESLLQVPPAGPLRRETPITRAFFYVSFRVPSKGAPPPGSHLRAPIQRDAPFPEPSFTCLSKTLGKEPPSWFPDGAPMERDAHSQGLHLHISWSPSEQGLLIKIEIHLSKGGMRWHSWLRHCSTSWKVTGSIQDGVTGIFHWHNPFGRTMALGSTQPLTQMSTRSISCGVKAAGA
jgi:hypothetical protein